MDSVTKFLMGEEVDGKYNPANNPDVANALNLLGIQSIGFYGSSEGPNMGYGMAQGVGQGMGQALPGLMSDLFKPKVSYGAPGGTSIMPNQQGSSYDWVTGRTY
jgi:hypothetical protein